jgi:hypothetical protein
MQSPSLAIASRDSPPPPWGKYRDFNWGVAGFGRGPFLGAGSAGELLQGEGSPPKPCPKGLSHDFITSKTTKSPKCHPGFGKSGPLCMVFLSCTDHPHTKIAPRSNF